MRFMEYLKEEKVLFSKPKEHKTKEISLHGDTVIVSTENPNPTAVSGVRNSLRRKKYKDEDTAREAYDKMITSSVKKAWIRRK
jgi:hypothetical protein